MNTIIRLEILLSNQYKPCESCDPKVEQNENLKNHI